VKVAIKILSLLVLIPIAFIGCLFLYYWLTYLDETVTKGEAYGFIIGDSKYATVENFEKIKSSYPNTHVFVRYGKRAGDSFSIAATLSASDKLAKHDKWDVLLEGQYEFFNSIDLKFEKGSLVEIHRHRQNFELP